MIYMVEIGFPHPERLAEWHDWYMEHIKVLLTLPGLLASPRFEAGKGSDVAFNVAGSCRLNGIYFEAKRGRHCELRRTDRSPTSAWRVEHGHPPSLRPDLLEQLRPFGTKAVFELHSIAATGAWTTTKTIGIAFVSL